MYFIKKKIDYKDIVCNIVVWFIVLFVRIIKELKIEIWKVLSFI